VYRGPVCHHDCERFARRLENAWLAVFAMPIRAFTIPIRAFAIAPNPQAGLCRVVATLRPVVTYKTRKPKIRLTPAARP
jgi:hypothetical protein